MEFIVEPGVLYFHIPQTHPWLFLKIIFVITLLIKQSHAGDLRRHDQQLASIIWKKWNGGQILSSRKNRQFVFIVRLRNPLGIDEINILVAIHVFVQSIEARCYVENGDVVGAAPAGDAPATCVWSIILKPT